MPIHRDPASQRRRLIRRVLGVRGEMTFRARLRPRFDYGRATAHDARSASTAPSFSSDDLRLALVTATDRSSRRRRRARRVHAHRRRERDRSSSSRPGEEPPPPLLRRRGGRGVRATRSTTGAAGSAIPRYRGRWREMVHRSALTLKLLTYAPDRRDRRRADHEPSRAARRRAQLGLPLHLDPRRGLLALRAAAARLHGGGRGVHAAGSRDRFRESSRRGDGPLQIMYGIDGRADLEEEVLDHLEGYRGSRRCGSATAPPTSSSSTSTAS